jgi:hypothetical protein
VELLSAARLVNAMLCACIESSTPFHDLTAAFIYPLEKQLLARAGFDDGWFGRQINVGVNELRGGGFGSSKDFNTWSQSYDFLIYSYNASVVVG